ncbi:hypothetical protein ZYGR_0AG03160 [Zygosaccharomyces rouxii]|uniref:C2H2-type domain-containing protein n=1 Tax=Zygosaccharomyces rouxii TaxID=4956 RepID=A0A1Q3A9F4_ZYGRO|nr:hypothetical protein ZYGR_0AG03160 [Zygosaccharomyces rouxii]
MPSQQRKYVCSFCSKAFSRSEHRARHERSHTGMKPFECKVCRHAFVRRDLLQRHIRTVHRELLLMKKGMEGGDKKSDLIVELLVNSMIKVTKREGSGLKGEKAEVLSRLIGGFLPETNLGAETAGKIFDCGVRCVERRMHSRFGAQIAAQLSGPLASSARAQQFVRVCTSSPLVLAVAALGACACGESCAADLWQVGWSSCLKTSTNVRYLSLNILVFALLDFGIKSDFADVFSIYQHTCYSVMVEGPGNEQFPEKWTVFHQWVTLMRYAETQSELTPFFYAWFERQELTLGKTLKDNLITLDEAESTVAEAIFCNWILSYNATPLDRAVEVFSRKSSGSTGGHLVVSQSHWLLLETAWFDFVKRLELSGFHTSSRMGWFRNCYVRGPQTRIQRDCIDERLMKIILPVLVAMDQEIGSCRVALVADVTLFLLRFAEEMDPNVMTDNDNVQNLIYILQRRADSKERLSFVDLQSGIISYLHGVALVLANLPSIDSDVRVPLMVAVQGSPLPRRSQSSDSPSPPWLLSPTSASSFADEKPKRTRSHSGSSIILPPLHVRPSSYAHGHAEYVPQVPVAAPFATTTIPTTSRTMETSNSWPTSRGFKVRLPPPSELFHIS